MTTERTLVIVNPAAGGGRVARVWRRLSPDARRLFPFDEHWTTAPKEATRIAADAAAAGFDRILAVGGDGTLHEVVNGVAGTHLAVGVLPLGTGNDFARSAGILRAPAPLLEALHRGGTRPIDLGRVHERYYINIAGAGFDAEVARRVNAMRSKAKGTIPYLMTAVGLAFRYEPPQMTVTLDDGPAMGPEARLLVAVGNTRAYGGGMQVCPRAEVDDGLLDVLLVGDVRGWATLGLLPKVFLGAHLGHPAVGYVRAHSVRLEGPAGVALHADGEVLGGLPATFSVHPAALRLWMPA